MKFTIVISGTSEVSDEYNNIESFKIRSCSSREFHKYCC